MNRRHPTLIVKARTMSAARAALALAGEHGVFCGTMSLARREFGSAVLELLVGSPVDRGAIRRLIAAVNLIPGIDVVEMTQRERAC